MKEDIQYLHYQTISRIGIWPILKTQHWRRKWPPPPRIIIFKYRLHIFPNTILWRNPIIIKEICSIFDYTRRMNWQVRNKQGFFLYTFWVKKFAYSMVYLFYIILFFSSDLNTYRRYASIFGGDMILTRDAIVNLETIVDHCPQNFENHRKTIGSNGWTPQKTFNGDGPTLSKPLKNHWRQWWPKKKH